MPQDLKTIYTTGNVAQITWDSIPCGSRGGNSPLSYSYEVLADSEAVSSGISEETTATITNLPCGTVTFKVAATSDVGTSTAFNTLDLDVISPG